MIFSNRVSFFKYQSNQIKILTSLIEKNIHKMSSGRCCITLFCRETRIKNILEFIKDDINWFNS